MKQSDTSYIPSGGVHDFMYVVVNQSVGSIPWITFVASLEMYLTVFVCKVRYCPTITLLNHACQF